MNKQKIVRDEKGNLVNWYGFTVIDDAENKKCYLKVAPDPGRAELYMDGQLLTEIYFLKMVIENQDKLPPVHTENEIWAYIYSEARKYVKGIIYVDRFDVEEGAASNVCGISAFSEKEISEEVYFMEQEEKYS